MGHGQAHSLSLNARVRRSQDPREVSGDGAFAITGAVLPLGSVPQELLGAVLVFLGGFLLGPTLLGLYLVISLNGFGAHPNEAFSALSIPDWKNFLRLKIDRDGAPWLYPVGIRRVPRAWKPGELARDPEWVSDDKKATPRCSSNRTSSSARRDP